MYAKTVMESIQLNLDFKKTKAQSEDVYVKEKREEKEENVTYGGKETELLRKKDNFHCVSYILGKGV